MDHSELKEDLMRKYRLAGKIRLISFSLLLGFLLLMKWIGGYTYLDPALLSLILVEAALNQPYDFLIRRVNIHRFQYYQMTVDIMAISWLLYYMGGLQAPVVSIAYYAVILWAGVASTEYAVFFAVLASTVSFAMVVILEYSGLLPNMSIYEGELPFERMLSLLVGNISYLFAFGYFSAHSSKVIKSLERKQRDESLRHAHRFSAIDHLISHSTHDILGRFYNAKACAELLLQGHAPDDKDNEMLQMIIDQEQEGIALLRRLSQFSRKGKPEFEPADLNGIVEDAVALTWPVVRYSKMTIQKELGRGIPPIKVIRDQIQEVFVALILNALDAAVGEATLTIRTSHDQEKNSVQIFFFDTGVGIKQEYLTQMEEPFLTVKQYRESLGTGLAISHEIISKHGGTMRLKSAVGGGKTTFAIQLPVDRPRSDDFEGKIGKMRNERKSS